MAKRKPNCFQMPGTCFGDNFLKYFFCSVCRWVYSSLKLEKSFEKSINLIKSIIKCYRCGIPKNNNKRLRSISDLEPKSNKVFHV